MRKWAARDPEASSFGCCFLHRLHKNCWCFSSKSGGSVRGWGSGRAEAEARGSLAAGHWKASLVKPLLARRLDARATGQLGKTARGLIPGASRPVKCEQMRAGDP